MELAPLSYRGTSLHMATLAAVSIFSPPSLVERRGFCLPSTGCSVLCSDDQAAPARQALGFVLSPSSDTPQRKRFTPADPGRFSLADDFVGPPFANTLKGTNPYPDGVTCVCAQNPAWEAALRGCGTGHWDTRRGTMLPGALCQAVP